MGTVCGQALTVIKSCTEKTIVFLMSGSSLGADNKHCFALVQYAVMLQRKVLHIRTHRTNNINVLFTVPLRMLCYFGPSRETTPGMIWYLNKLSQLETKATFKLLNSDLSL